MNMSNIYFRKGHKQLLENIILNLTKKKISSGGISLVKKNKKHKQKLLKYTNFPADVINIILDYTNEIIKLTINSSIIKCQYEGKCVNNKLISDFKLNLSMYVQVKLDNVFDFMLCCSCYDTKVTIETYIHNIKSNILNKYCYSSLDYDEKTNLAIKHL